MEISTVKKFDPKFVARIEEQTRLMNELLAAIKANLPELKKILEANRSKHGCEDDVYRFYHQSYKVYKIQDTTLHIVAALQRLLPGRELNPWFREIITEGTGKAFKVEDNDNWLAVTRPMLEAYFHANYFIEMAVKYGEELDSQPQIMPYGWAALLSLYDIR